MAHTVIYDACVLYPASLRSFLMWIGFHELVHTRWTEQILDECFDNLLDDRPDLDPESLARTRQLMCEAIPDCLVADYEDNIAALKLPDPDDRHVLAAAIEANANAIITFNLSDFPDDKLAEYEIVAIHPDDYVFELLAQHPATILQCLHDEAGIRNNPPCTVRGVAKALGRAGLTRSEPRLLELLSP